MAALPALKMALQALQIAGPVFLQILEAIQQAKAAAPEGMRPTPEAVRLAVVEALLDPADDGEASTV